MRVFGRTGPHGIFEDFSHGYVPPKVSESHGFRRRYAESSEHVFMPKVGGESGIDVHLVAFQITVRIRKRKIKKGNKNYRKRKQK